MSKFELNAGFYPEADPLSMTFHRRELSLPEWGLTTVASQVEYLLRYVTGYTFLCGLTVFLSRNFATLYRRAWNLCVDIHGY